MRAATAIVLTASCLTCGQTLSQQASQQTGSAPYLRARIAWESGLSYRPKIMDGRDITLKERPWQVALVMSDNSDNHTALFCGGAFLAPEWVVTAAHCLDGMRTDQFRVLHGLDHLSQPGERTEVVSIKLSNAYNRATLANDVALVRLNRPAKNASYLPVLPASRESSALNAGTVVTISGWGNTYDWGVRALQLQFASIPIVPFSDCKKPESIGPQLHPSMFCAGLPDGSKDACQGDSGGPATLLLPEGVYLAGLVSGGEGCGKPKKYGLYSRLAIHASWISEVMKQN